MAMHAPSNARSIPRYAAHRCAAELPNRTTKLAAQTLTSERRLPMPYFCDTYNDERNASKLEYENSPKLRSDWCRFLSAADRLRRQYPPTPPAALNVNWANPDWDSIYYCHDCGAWAPATHRHA
jgi:hypothetical protein